MLDRRMVLAGGAALLATGAGAGALRLDAALAGIEATLAGGRLGVSVLDTGSGRRIAWRADERFAMASTFKAVLAAMVLARADAGTLDLAMPVRFGRADLLDHAPAVAAAIDAGSLTIAQLAEAAVVLSDNSAANLLLARIGGPAGLTGFVRRIGDRTTRFDRIEPDLNTNLPGDPRDTTTPAAMIGLLRPILTGGVVLRPAAQARLIGWMAASRTGLARLRAGLPADWRIGDKTGTGQRGAANVIAIAIPPKRAPILIASFVDAPAARSEARDAAHAAVGRLVATHLAAG